MKAGRQLEASPDDTLLDVCHHLFSTIPLIRYLPVVERNPDCGAILHILNLTVLIRYLVFHVRQYRIVSLLLNAMFIQEFHRELDGLTEPFLSLGIGGSPSAFFFFEIEVHFSFTPPPK